MRLFLFSLFFVVSALADETGERAGHFGLRLSAGGAVYGSAIDNATNKTAADSARTSVKDPVTGEDKLSVPDYTKYVAAGWTTPFQVEGTYGITDAFELLVGVRYNLSDAFTGSDKYIMKSVGAALGYRYYFNAKDPIQAYLSGQLAIDLTEFVRGEARLGAGFLFSINSTVGIFLEGNFMVAGIYNSDNAIGKGVQLGAGLGTGLALQF